MKRIGRFLEWLLPHLIIIISVMILTFVIINFFNPYMQFVENRFTQWLLVAFGVMSIVSSCLLIYRSRPRK